MKIVVIGANSYIARNLIYKLGQMDDAKLLLYDREEAHKDNCAGYQPVNILSKESVAGMDLDADIIYMFVGKTGTADGFKDPDVFIDINEKALLYVLNEYVRQGSKAKLVFPSTRLLYDDNGCAREEDVSRTLKTIYAVNKLACEQYLRTYHAVYDVRYCIVRICVPYGNFLDDAYSYGTIGFMLSKAKNKENITLYGDGSSRRTLTYIGDLCEYLIKAGQSPVCENDVYNIGGEAYSLKEMAELIAERFGISVEHIDFPELAEKIESKDTVFDSGKLENAIGKNDYTGFAGWLDKVITDRI